jgi:hypothetical protein
MIVKKIMICEKEPKTTKRIKNGQNETFKITCFVVKFGTVRINHRLIVYFA